MLVAAVGTAAIAFASGLFLAWNGGPVIFWLGVLSVVCAFAYTGGPLPLAYRGLGDLFVLIFFGFVATIGTAWCQTYTGDAARTLQFIPYWWWFIAAVIGVQATAIIAINNHRDRDTDRIVGKMTLAARLGTENSIMYQCALPALAVACLGTATWMSGQWLLLAAVAPAMIGGAVICRHLSERDGQALNGTLALAGIVEMLTGLALTIALILR
jgi:1,4-dihydroxy-2-naphthoate octaprenyltransferase